MDPDWDLSAVVRSCSSTMSPRFPPTADRAFSTTDKPVAEEGEEPLACLASLTFEDDDDSHLLRYPDMSQPEKYGSLSQSYPPFFTSTPTNSGTNPSDLVNPPSSTSLLGVSIVADHVCHLDPHAGTSGIAPSQPTSASPPLVFLHRPPNYQQQPQQLVGPPKRRSPAVSRATVPHPPRPKKLSRKSLLKRTVTHVTADNLSSDQWSWRKYGQKPIKGSPHPRNYYRCSSSKGCSARKQVELSKSDPDMYVVTYTGDHTHPRPNYRNSLAGSTRNRVGSAPRLAAEAMEGSSSSLLSATSSTVGTGEASSAQYAEVEDNQVDEETEEMVAAKKTMDVESEDDDEDLLIPNLVLDDDLFKGLKELSGGGFGQSPSFEDNFSSGSSAGGAAARSG